MNRADLEVDINDEYIVDIWFHSDSILTVEPSGETFLSGTMSVEMESKTYRYRIKVNRLDLTDKSKDSILSLLGRVV